MGQHIDILQATALAFIQGLTEFLPISSSGHLAMIPLITDWPDQGLAFDCVVHLGTLTAVVLYFRRELSVMTAGLFRTISHRSWRADADGRLAWLILIATIPVGLAGLALKDLVESDLRSIVVIAIASIGFGLLLWLADSRNRPDKNERSWNLRDALVVGFGQALALIPGTSRSGITMTMALFLGYDRRSASRFSFLLSIPVIALAGGLKVKDWLEQPVQASSASELLIGFAVSAVTAYTCIYLFLGFIERMGMKPFVAYRVVLGVVLLALM